MLTPHLHLFVDAFMVAAGKPYDIARLDVQLKRFSRRIAKALLRAFSI